MELVKTTSFEEFMEEYTELMSVNENFNSNDNKEIITETNQEGSSLDRRDFLKYSALGTATLIMGATTEEAEAFFPLIIGAIALGASAWASSESIDWRITIGNGTNRDQKVPSEWELVEESDYDVLDSESYTFNIPRGKARTYRNTSLKANIRRSIYALIQGNIGGIGTTSPLFRIIGRG